MVSIVPQKSFKKKQSKVRKEMPFPNTTVVVIAMLLIFTIIVNINARYQKFAETCFNITEASRSTFRKNGTKFEELKEDGRFKNAAYHNNSFSMLCALLGACIGAMAVMVFKELQYLAKMYKKAENSEQPTTVNLNIAV